MANKISGSNSGNILDRLPMRATGLRAIYFGHSYLDNEGITGATILAGTMALGSFTWANMLLDHPWTVIKAAGVGGERIRDIIQRYDLHVGQYDPDIIFISIGHNDLNNVIGTGAGNPQIDTGILYKADNRQYNLDYLLSGVRRLLDIIPSHVLVVFTGETQPGRDLSAVASTNMHKQLGQRFQNFNRRLMNLCAQYRNVMYIPTELVILDPTDTSLANTTGTYTDNVHPSIAAARLRGKMIAKYMQRVLPIHTPLLPVSVGEVFLNQRLPFTNISGDGSIVTITMDNSAPGNHVAIGRIKEGDVICIQCPNDPTWDMTKTVTNASTTAIQVESTVKGTTNTGHVCNCPQMLENPLFTTQTGGTNGGGITLTGNLPASWTLTGVNQTFPVTVSYVAHSGRDSDVEPSLGYFLRLAITAPGAGEVSLRGTASNQSTGSSFYRRLHDGEKIITGCEVSVVGTPSGFDGFELRNLFYDGTTSKYSCEAYRGTDVSPWPQTTDRLTMMTQECAVPAGVMSAAPGGSAVVNSTLYMRFSGAGTLTVDIGRFGTFRIDESLTPTPIALQ